MKKILMALVVAFTTVVCNAASYDEEQLLGYWEVTSMEGYPSPEIQSFTGLYFGSVYILGSSLDQSEYESADDYIFWEGGKVSISNDEIEVSGTGFIENGYFADYDETEDAILLSFSITNENKLHIESWGMQFKIEELTANSMKLVTYTQKIPCRITFKKTDKYSAAVKSVAADVENENRASYDVEGRRVSSNHKGLVISGSKGKYRKTIRK